MVEFPISMEGWKVFSSGVIDQREESIKIIDQWEESIRSIAPLNCRVNNIPVTGSHHLPEQAGAYQQQPASSIGNLDKSFLEWNTISSSLFLCPVTCRALHWRLEEYPDVHGVNTVSSATLQTLHDILTRRSILGSVSILYYNWLCQNVNLVWGVLLPI